MRNQTHVDDAVRRTVEAVWRMESGHLIAALTRLTRDVGLAEDLAQEALIAPLGIDVFRRNQTLTRKTAELGHVPLHSIR